MAGLNHTLNVGAEALFATRQGVDTASHNIANANTPGYSRQRANLHTRDPSYSRGVIIGNGVFVKNIQRSHDKFLEKQLNAAAQSTGRSDGRVNALEGLESIYSPELSASVVDEVTNFFGSLQNLSSYPEEIASRTNLRESASALITSFKRVDESLKNEKRNLDEKIAMSAAEITGKLKRIAELNIGIGDMESGRPDYLANDLRDEQERLLREISQDIDINYYQNRDGLLVVRGPKDSLLVDGKFCSSIETRLSPEYGGMHGLVVVDHERSRVDDLTPKITKGRISSLIEVRDTVIDKLLAKNEEMARTMSEEVNAVHRRGFGMNGFREVSGLNFFEGSEKSGEFVKTMKLTDPIIDSIDAISAASTPNSPGDNVIANDLLRLRDKQMLSNESATLTQYYSDYVGQLSVDIVASKHRSEADNIVSNDLNARREAVSGVSLDEEALNMLKWQANFAASSKVITTTDEMMETVLNLKR